MLATPGDSGAVLDRVYVSLDLETTGLDVDRDVIIQVGAVKFRGTEVLDTFDHLVNPYRMLPNFITQLTGITQSDVDGAAPWPEVAEPLLAFLADYPLVGHSISFDLAMLSKAALNLTNAKYDTHDLATVFIPKATEYSLTGLAQSLGISHKKPHRALEDASICHQLFLALLERALDTEKGVLEAMAAIADRSVWPLKSLLSQIGWEAPDNGPRSVGILGLDMESLRQRLSRPRPVRPRENQPSIPKEAIEGLFGEAGALSRVVPGYETRREQIQMAHAVAESLNEGRHLMVEAGTGVGKSLAYLLPAMLYASGKGTRVVVSTNTINLQSQLVNKDLPLLNKALDCSEDGPQSELQFTLLKGKTNYLCLRRWSHLARSGSLPSEEARMVSKALVWLQETDTGDRAEINIPRRDGYLWDKLSAVTANECETLNGLCPLRTARARAEGSHIVVVNHALLLSDLAAGGGVIPPYDHLIVDEAHHLEDEARRQLGYDVSSQSVDDMAEDLVRSAQDARATVRLATTNRFHLERLAELTDGLRGTAQRLRQTWDGLAKRVTRFVENHREYADQGNQLRITRSSRKQPDWSNIEMQWENLNQVMVDSTNQVERLLIAFEPLESAPLQDVLLELKGWKERAEEARSRIEDFVLQPEQEYVYWVTLSGADAAPTLSAAPLEVGPKLHEMLFSQKRSVILTSATLSVEGSLDYMAKSVGLEEADRLIVGSPFDYKTSTLVLTVPDIPEPSGSGYQQAVEDGLMKAARASQGNLLGLFTSNSALQSTRRRIKPLLEAEGIPVLAQGIDGPPGQLMEAMRASGNTVLLGTSSFWEGVDLPGDLLRVVVLARLPFSVPTEPVFAARSERYDEPFSEHAVPQAVLRFRQGFGRLIRTKSDRGVVVVLDSRIVNKNYGRVFLRSLPESRMKQATSREIEDEIRDWLKKP